MLKKILTLAFVLMPLFGLHKGALDVSSVDVNAKIDLDVGQFIDGYMIDSYFVGVGFLSTNDGKGPAMGVVDFMYHNEVPQALGLRIGMGLQYIGSMHNQQSFNAIPFRVEFEYKIPTQAGIPFYLLSSLAFAPIPLTFGDSSTYFSFDAMAAYDIIPLMRLYGGFRTINTNYKTFDYLFNQTFFAGMRVRF